MPAAQRAFPYIWTTWLTKLLTGESSCEWAAWFRAHHQGWERPPNDFNFAQWQLDHTALLNDTRRRFEDSGYDVRVEGQNSFRLQGRIATLAGQPDLIVPSGDHILIVDAKTGAERASHVAQVMVYMYALPRALERYKDARIAGEVHYSNRIQRVPQGGIDQGFIHRLITLIHRVAAPDSPPWTPSAAECRFCDITDADCPARVESASGPENATETTSDAVRVIAVQGTPWNNAGRFLRRCPFTRAVAANNSIRGDKRESRRCHCRHHRRRDHRVFI